MPASFQDLIELMRRLRAPDGCPWDREQTYASLAPMLLEEAYEAFEAVEAAREGRPAELRDELGDLLFQIVFYAQLASERGEFDMNDVTDAVHTKMVRRHPHIFGTTRADDTSEVLRNWEAIKAEEKRAAGITEPADASLLDGVSHKAPALMEAHQLATKAARVGFDWDKVSDVIAKAREELDELEEAIEQRSRADEAATHGDGETDAVREELGDLLFAVANVARHLKIEPEAALKIANSKFRRRFRFVETGLRAEGRELQSASLDEMEALWREAKRGE